MNRILAAAALLCGVALPAHAATYTCNDTHSNWTLVLQPHVANEVDRASFWEERANSSMHTGSYVNDKNGTTVYLDNGWIQLNQINVGDWSLDSASGTINCTLRASPDTPSAPVATPAPPPPAPAPAPRYLVDTCLVDNRAEVWMVGFDTVRGEAQFWQKGQLDGRRWGPYTATGTSMTAVVGPPTAKINLSMVYVGDQPQLTWVEGAKSGVLHCQLASNSDVKPDEWFDAQPTSPPVTAQQPSAVAPPANNTVALVSTTGGFDEQVAVNLGSQAVIMLLDTGATSGTVTQSVADSLIAAGEATYGAKGKVTLANGAEVDEQTLVVKTLAIGGHQLHDVRLGVTPDGGMSLLGMNVLRQFGRFTIDTDKNRLTLG